MMNNESRHIMLMNHKPQRNLKFTYKRNRANPFLPSGGSELWNRSELILKDPVLRAKAGVSQLDESLARSYEANPEKITR